MTKYTLLFFWLCSSSILPAETNSKFGTYVGKMTHQKTDADQMVKLDLIFSRGADSEFELRAVISFYFGNFSSDEYVSYHYDKVSYNLLTGDLVFDQSDQDLTIIGQLSENGLFSGTVRSSIAGNVGELSLSKNGQAKISQSLVRSLQGQYVGSCDGNKTVMNLFTLKATNDTLRLGNPFGSYFVTGVLGDNSSFSCNSRNGYCTSDLVYSASYDYFQGQLEFFTRRTSYSCKVNDRNLDCGKCKFIKTIKNTDSDQIRKPLKFNNVLLNSDNKLDSLALGTSTSVAGEYKGYLHHERQDFYQAAQINIKTFQDTSSSGQTLQMAATAKLFFGDFKSSEFIPYRFDQKSFNIINKVFVFERMSDDVEPVLQVTNLSNGVIRGIWYSILFGRVGTFELKKDSSPVLPQSLKTFSKINGDYESSKMNLQISSRLDTSPVNSENPFFPRMISGYFIYKSGITARLDIVDASYDFYTGKIGFFVQSDKRISTGILSTAKDIFSVTWPPRVIGGPLQTDNTEVFRKK